MCWRQLFIITKEYGANKDPHVDGNKYDQVLFHVDLQWFCWHCCIFIYFLYHSTVNLFMSVYIITCQCHMSLPSNNSVGVHSVFCPKTSRIFQLDTFRFLFPLIYLFLTFLHRHDFDVLLTNLIDVSDIVVRNGRQISAVDLEWHWNARFVLGDRFIPPGGFKILFQPTPLQGLSLF